MFTGMLSIAASADDERPPDWWSYMEPYNNAVSEGDPDKIIATGKAFEEYYLQYPMNMKIASDLMNVYVKFNELLYFENKGDYDSALEYTRKRMETAQYIYDHNGDYIDVIISAKAHEQLLTPLTGVYAVSYTQNISRGTKAESTSGTRYGTPALGYFSTNGKGSIVSVYVEMEENTLRNEERWFKNYDDGQHVIQVNLNFKNEVKTPSRVLKGDYDSNIEETMKSIADIKSPVTLRIGAEMNIWSCPTSEAETFRNDFKEAFKYIVKKARSIAPNVEIIWSPMAVCKWGETLDQYWPGDEYVDWVGTSLYFNYGRYDSDSRAWVEHTRSMQYADPVGKAKLIVEFADAHNKPVAVTEGGCRKDDPILGNTAEDFAVKLTAKEYSTLNMVYPQIRSIIHFDQSNADGDFLLNGKLLSAVEDAINNNPTLISNGESKAGSYIPLENFSETVDGQLIIGATGLTYNNTDVTVKYYLDGTNVANPTSSPNQYKLDVSSLSDGNHTLKVTFDDLHGYTVEKIYTLTKDNTKISCKLGSSGSTQTDHVFSDVPSDAYYFDAVNWAYDNSITTGKTDTEFGPNETCTRAHVVTFLWRAFGSPSPSDRTNPFTDVPENAYYTNAVLWAVEKGITKGSSATTFNPDQTCSTAHILTFLYRAFGIGADGYYQDAAKWANDENLLKDTGVTVDPTEDCSRANVVTFLYRKLA